MDPLENVKQVSLSYSILTTIIKLYFSDLFTSLIKRVTFGGETSGIDEANQIAYSLLLEHLSQLHHDREFRLSTADLQALPKMLRDRQRSNNAQPSPFINTSVG